MYQDIINKYKENFAEAVGFFKSELGNVRTGRASASLVENIQVEAYGTTSPMNQVASVNVPEPRLITIQPWDKNLMAEIETALQNSDIGINPNNDGVMIRLAMPSLTQDRREQLVKVINGKAEEARIVIRTVREDIWQAIQDAEESGEIAEDDKFKGKEKLQSVVDEQNKAIESLRAKKEEEIMTV